MGDLHDLEADLAALQDNAGLPRFDRSKPLTEWLTILGVSKELIERVRVCLDAVEAIREGRAKALLAERASAEQSALAQLCRNRQGAIDQIGRTPSEPPGSHSA